MASLIPLPKSPLENTFHRSMAAEFIGTCFLVSSIVLGTANSQFPPLTIGFMLLTQVFAFGYVSGGQFNCAVTTAVHLVKWKRGEEPNNLAGFLFYDWLREVISQLLGGFSGALIAWFVSGKSWSEGKFPAPMPQTQDSIDVGRAFVAELFFTFALCSVVLNCAVSKAYANHGNSFYGLAIGVTVFVGASSVGPISGGAFNPAVATALQVVQLLAKQDGEHTAIHYIWLYWLAPLLAAFMASVVFCLISCEDREMDPRLKASLNHREPETATEDTTLLAKSVF